MQRTASSWSIAGLAALATGAALVGSEIIAPPVRNEVASVSFSGRFDPWFFRALLWACGETAAVAVLGLMLALALGRTGRWATEATSAAERLVPALGGAALHAGRSVVSAIDPVLWALLLGALLRLETGAAVLALGLGWGAVVAGSPAAQPLRWLAPVLASSAAMGMAGAGGVGTVFQRAVERGALGEMTATLAALVALTALGAVASRVARDPSHPNRLTVLAALATVVAAQSLTAPLRELVSSDTLQVFAELPARLWPPERSPEVILDARRGLIETISMSIAATVLGGLLAAALARTKSAPPAAPAPTPLYLTTATTLGLALVLVTWVGLGPFSGTLALAAHSTTTVLARTGRTSRWRDFVGTSLDAWSANVRIASVVGIVGAGGVGFYAAYALGTYNGHALSTHLMVAVLLAILVDAVAAEIRRRLLAS